METNDGPAGSIILDRRMAWLPSWIADQIRRGAGRRAELAGVRGDAMYVYGSIAAEAVLTSLGEVWVGDHDLDTVGTTTRLTWRRTEGLERVGFIVIAARRFAPLRALLPDRPTNAASCRACRGTGDWHVFSADGKESLRISGMICKACGGLGWQPPTAG